MTEDERLDWESARWSSHKAEVYVLDSGRIAVFRDGSLYSIHESSDGLIESLKAIKAMPLPEYVPPLHRKKTQLSDLALNFD